MNRSASGISNMFDRAGAGFNNQKSSRDSLPDSLLGVNDAQRQLAIELDVDPYTDFAPLQNRLQEMARVITGGKLTVKAGLAAVTGGVGMGISAASSIEGAKDTLRDKTAAQVIAEVRVHPGVPCRSRKKPQTALSRTGTTRRPSCCSCRARWLATPRAEHGRLMSNALPMPIPMASHTSIARRADLIAARSAQLGGLVAFVPVAGHVVNVTRDGTAVAVFPLDDLAWTEQPKRTFLAANAELRRQSPNGAAVFATTGPGDAIGFGRDQEARLADRSAQIVAAWRAAVRAGATGRNLARDEPRLARGLAGLAGFFAVFAAAGGSGASSIDFRRPPVKL